METASTISKCVLCGGTDVATLTIPSKGAVCLTCIRSLNTTVEELVGASQKLPVETNGSYRVDTPAAPPPILDLLDGYQKRVPEFPENDHHFSSCPQFPEAKRLVPGKKRKATPGFFLQVIAGGLAGLFIGLMILHYVFKVDLWNAGGNGLIPKSAPAHKLEVSKGVSFIPYKRLQPAS